MLQRLPSYASEASRLSKNNYEGELSHIIYRATNVTLLRQHSVPSVRTIRML